MIWLTWREFIPVPAGTGAAGGFPEGHLEIDPVLTVVGVNPDTRRIICAGCRRSVWYYTRLACLLEMLLGPAVDFHLRCSCVLDWAAA